LPKNGARVRSRGYPAKEVIDGRNWGDRCHGIQVADAV
jgi:hypothetical protein